MTDVSNIYQRIGEAMASKGLYDLVSANTPGEEAILVDAGFSKVGSMKQEGQIVSLYKLEQKVKEVVKIVEVPTKQPSFPWNTHKEVPGRPDIWYLNDNKPYHMYSYGTGTGDADWMNHLGTTLSSNYTSNSSTGLNKEINEYLTNSISKLSSNSSDVKDILSQIAYNTQPNKKN